MTDEASHTQQAPDPAQPRGRPKALWIALGIGLAVLLAAGGALWWWRAGTSPTASIGRLARAAVNRDVAAVEAAIDTTALIGSAVDDIYNDPHFRQSYVNSYTARHPGVTREQIKARLERSVSEELREHVSTGTLPKRIPLPADSLKALVAEAYARHSVKSITIRGNYAYATVVVPYHGENVEVVVRLRKSGNGWTVDRIENLADALKQAGY
jgi:hypothetical protein